MHLEGRTVLVTGGASGLGWAVAQMIAEDLGGRVIILDLADKPPALIPGAPPPLVHVQGDITNEVDIRRALARVTEHGGQLHGLVNAAGIAVAERVLPRDGPQPLESFRRSIDVNLVGTFNAIRLAAAAMSVNPADESGERGVIVNTASVAAFDGQIGQAAYAASKGGIVAMTLPLAREFARLGIRVVTIAPGTFDTPLLHGLPEAARESLALQVPFPPRLGRPDEYAALVRHIFENQMLNGTVIRLDGAMRMGAK